MGGMKVVLQNIFSLHGFYYGYLLQIVASSRAVARRGGYYIIAFQKLRNALIIVLCWWV
jgi:hypothetical protein